MSHAVTLIPGDGIGPEITVVTRKVLEATGVKFEWDEQVAGMAGVDRSGDPLPDATVESIRRTHLALKGPLTTPVGTGYRSVNVGLRKEFELYANLRPVRSFRGIGKFANVDLVLVRENVEGLYVGVEHFVRVGSDPRAVAESMAIVTRVGLRADRALRLRVRAAERPQEGHDRPQGQHPQDGERALPRGRPRGGARSTRGASRSTTSSSTTPPCRWSSGPSSSTCWSPPTCSATS